MDINRNFCYDCPFNIKSNHHNMLDIIKTRIDNGGLPYRCHTATPNPNKEKWYESTASTVCVGQQLYYEKLSSKD